MPRKPLPFIKTVRSKGKTYEYFVTGKAVDGKPVLARLPSRSDSSFGGAYAGMLAARTARAGIAKAMTMTELSRAYQLDGIFKKRSEGTQSTYLIYLRVIEEAIGNAPINRVERRDVQALLDKMQGRPGAANMTLLVLRNLFRLAVKREWVTRNPTTDIDQLETSGEGHEPWPEWLIGEGLADDRVRVAVALLYYTAQRIGDVVRMRWSDIRDGYVSVKQEKTGKELDIQIHSDLLAVLARTPKVAMTILHNPRMQPISASGLRQKLQRFAVEHGQEIVPHGLRKNAVNALLEAGCSTAETSAISGQTLQLVEHYAKRRDNRKLGSAAIIRWEGTKRVDRKPRKTEGTA